MKILKGMFYYILILLLILLFAAWLAPAQKSVERSLAIKAPARTIFPLVTQYELSKEWDPWYSLDPDQLREVTGEFGDPDYAYRWESAHRRVRRGRVRTVGFVPNQWAESLLETGEGWQAWELLSRFELKEEGGTTLVHWSMTSKRSFPYRILHLLLERYMGDRLEEGLAQLKEVALKRKDNAGPEVELSSIHGVNYAVVKGLVPFRKIDSFCAESYPRIFAHIRQNGLEVHSSPRAMYYTWDTENKETQMATAVAISDPGDAQWDSVQIAVGEAELHVDHISYVMDGPYSQAKAVHAALADWISESGKTTLPPPMEEYIKGPFDQVDSADYKTRIIYFFE